MAAVDFDRLSLLADVKLTSCPPQVLTQRLQWAAQRFIQLSEVWTYVQNQDVVAYQNDYTLAFPSDNSIIKRISGVWYGTESYKMLTSSRVDECNYELYLTRSSVVVGDTAVPSTPDPDVRGTYQDSGQEYGGQILYKYGNNEYYLWWDGSQWNISAEAGDTDDSFIGSGGATIDGDYTAAGGAAGSVASVSGTNVAVSFLEPYTSAVTSGLTTKIAVYPNISNTDEIPDAQMDEWGIRGFMEMAIADLKKDKNQPWEDQDGAKLHERTYKVSLSEARRQIFNKRKAGDLRVRARYFA